MGGLVRAAAHRGERDGASTTKKYNQMTYLTIIAFVGIGTSTEHFIKVQCGSEQK